MALEMPTVTTGGKGASLLSTFPLSAMANPCPERLTPTASLYVPVFANDPIINYMLCSMPTQSARLAYLPNYFHALLKAAALNDASFDAIGPDGKYEACA